MIIVIRSSANSEERGHLMTLLCRVSGSQRPIAATRINGREVIALDGSILDAQIRSTISQQKAVERIVPIKTAYKLASRAFKETDSAVVVGDALGARPVVIGDATPIIIAGPCAVEIGTDRKSTRLNSSHLVISYAVFCLKKKKKKNT